MMQMTKSKALMNVQAGIQEGISLAKCKKCGCMRDALENMKTTLSTIKGQASAHTLLNVEGALKQLEQTQYLCLGCERCIGAEITNAFSEAFPEAEVTPHSCSFEVRGNTWPPVVGEYFSVCDDPDCSVAVSTLASVDLAETLARMKPKGLCIVGKTETENIGIDKVIKNIITNPAIRFLILTGKDPEGHLSGKTLLALWQNGVDEKMRVVSAPGTHPVLKNVTLKEVEGFREQIKVIDLIGCEDSASIAKRISRLSRTPKKTCTCAECAQEEAKPISVSSVPIVQADKESKTETDKAGYFVIIPQPSKKTIIAEHYSYDNTLLHAIEGADAQSVYATLIKNGWVTQLSHAAYLGKELSKTELSIRHGFKYTQDLTVSSQHSTQRNQR